MPSSTAEQAFVQQKHAVLSGRSGAGIDAIHLVFADQVLDGGRHPIIRGGHQGRRLLGQKRLRQHADQSRWRAECDLVLLFLRNTPQIRLMVLAAPDVCSVAKTTWPVLRPPRWRRDGRQVTAFADQHDVGVHTQRPAYRLREVGTSTPISR